MSTRKPICRIIGIIVLMAVGFLVIPPLMENTAIRSTNFHLKKIILTLRTWVPKL